MAEKLHINNKIEQKQALKLSTFKKHVRKTEPHKHDNYFEIVFLVSGAGFHFIDARRFAVEPPVLFCIRREQVHYWDLQAEPDGYVLLIRKAFIENCLDKSIRQFLVKLSDQPCLSVVDGTAISQLFSLLMIELNADNNAFVIEGLLKALLAKLATQAQPAHNKTRPSNAYESFLELLVMQNAIKNSVAYYAGLLHTTPQNLNAICRKAENRPASQILAEHIIGEAKRLLLYTDNSIAEISGMLEFADASHFGKYFKRATGQTPQGFRQSTT